MVLAAGLGTRLRPLTYLRAKPAIPLLGRPLIQYALDRLAETGVRETVINLHHLPKTVIDAATRTDMQIHFSREEPILGTAGALRKVRERLAGSTVMLVNGKIYSEEEFDHVVEFHRDRQALVTLMVRPYWEGCPFNPVLVGPDLRVRGFSRRQPSGRTLKELETDSGLRPFVFTGVHILAPEVLDRIGEGFSDTVADLYPPLIEQNRRILAFISNHLWFETSTPERYLEKSIDLLRRQAGDGKPDGHNPDHVDVVLGLQARIGPRVSLNRCVLWDRVDLAGNISATDSIFTEGVNIRGDRDFRNCIVTSRSPDLEHHARESAARVLDDCICWPLRFSTSPGRGRETA